MSSRLGEPDSGIAISTSEVTGLGAALYVVGACVGALFFGWLTDRFGRKELFMITLALYLLATALTAISWTAWWFFLFRFFTGFGIGGEYAAINSAIDELIPRNHRGRIGIVINGRYWLGALGGSLLSIPALDKGIFAADVGWRLTFALGVVLGLTILLVRRSVPEGPRWLFIHGRERQAEQIVDELGQGRDASEFGDEQEEKTHWPLLFTRGYLSRTIFACVFWIAIVLPYFGLTFFQADVLDTIGLSDLPIVITVICFFGYLLFYGIMSILPGIYPIEVFPTSVRTSGEGVASAASRAGATAGTFLLPLSISAFGLSASLAGLAVIGAIGGVTSVVLAPGTARRPLTETDGRAGVRRRAVVTA